MAVSLSVWALELIEHLNRHMDDEREALRAYGELARSAGDARVETLIGQILEDEVRHHQQFANLRDGLRAEFEQRGGSRPGVRSDRDVTALVERTEQLLALEKADLRELRRLARQFRKVEDTTWSAVIVEAMQFDTRKHMRLLEGVRDLLRESAG